ncbi:MAG: hypothetical protein AABZ02_12010 [Bacteroidota bacterium]
MVRHPERSPELAEGRSEGSDKQLRRAAEPKTAYSAKTSPKSDSSVVPLGEQAGLPQNDRRAKCFLVPADEIRANGNPSLRDKYDLSISRYKEIQHKEIEYEKPDVIMAKVLELEKEIARDIQSINAMIR